MSALGRLLPIALLPAALAVADDDVFIADRNVALREGPAATARVRARLPIGARAILLDRDAGWLRVEVPSAARSGWVSAGAAAVFSAGSDTSREMAVVGRFLATDPTRRPLAAALLLAATDRLRREGRPESPLRARTG